MAAVALGRDFAFQVSAQDYCTTGVDAVDVLSGGLPRGCLTEICGPASSGRTSLMLAALAQATGREESCALVDASDAFDPVSAAAWGVALERVLWVRCGGHAEHALKATDLLVQGGGFGLVVMDLGDTPVATARRISMTSWFRLRRAQAAWTGAAGCSRLLRGIRVRVERHKPAPAKESLFIAQW